MVINLSSNFFIWFQNKNCKNRTEIPKHLNLLDVPATGETSVGGLVGSNHSSVTRSYSIGLVSGEINVGGFVGDKWYGSVAASFWDTETSGQSSSIGGTGLTTPEMKTASTFLEANWDFIDETANGTEDVWWILEGQDYPRLWWEPIPEN